MYSKCNEWPVVKRRSFAGHAIYAYLTGASSSSIEKSGQEERCHFAVTENLPVVSFDQRNSHGNDQQDRCKPGAKQADK